MQLELRPSAKVVNKLIPTPLKILECGVWIGENAERMYKDMNISELTLIDRWFERYEHYSFPEVKTFPQKVFDKFYDKDNVIIIRSDTLKAVRYFKNEYFDYIYLDDNHSYEHVKQELELYFPKLKKGGVYAGDNYEMAGVSKAVNEFRVKYKLNFETERWQKGINGTSGIDWWVIK